MILERGEGREKERERNIDVKEKYPLAAFCTHPAGVTENPLGGLVTLGSFCLSWVGTVALNARVW